MVAIEVGSGRCWDYEKDAFVERGGWRECDRRNTLGSQALAEPAAGGKKVNDMTAEVREVFDSQLTSALEEQVSKEGRNEGGHGCLREGQDAQDARSSSTGRFCDD